MQPGNDIKQRVEYFSDWDYNIKVAGVKFRQRELDELYEEDWNDLQVEIQAEPENKYDSNAIAIWVNRPNKDSIQMGYIPAMVAEALHDSGTDITKFKCALVYITSGDRGKIRTAKIALKEG